VPGWSNIFTQPIINRIEMLSTGVRTDIGIKVFGPDLETVNRVCQEIERAVKPVRGARDVVAAQVFGKAYLDVTIDRKFGFLGGDADFYFAVNNIGNTRAPLYPTNSSNPGLFYPIGGNISNYYEDMGRYFTIGLRGNF